MYLLHEHGCVWDVHWQPCRQPRPHEASDGANGSTVPVAGLLACSFGDGTLQVVAVPSPAAIDGASEQPVCVRTRRPLFTARIPHVALWRNAWRDERLLAAGANDGERAATRCPAWPVAACAHA